MRRHELESHDPALFAELARRCEVGYLGLVTADGTPRVVPLNFAVVGQDIYFHGALAGEKFDLLQAAPRVSFMMALPLQRAAVVLAGEGLRLPGDPLLQVGGCARDLRPLRRRRREGPRPAGPDGEVPARGRSTRPITADNPLYTKALRTVGVYRIAVESWTGKVKFGVNEPEAIRRKMIARLRERGEPRDLETADEIEKTLRDSE